MNFFQGELLTLFRGRSEFQDARYVGRACYVPLPDGTKIKAEFVTGMMGNQYDALRLTAISPTEGKMDVELLRFSDYFRKVPRSNLDSITPYMWVYNGKAEWYVAPSKADKEELADAACEYVNLDALLEITTMKHDTGLASCTWRDAVFRRIQLKHSTGT